MAWTRSPWMRLLATAASVALVVRYWDERGGFFWLGVALLALNVVGLAATRDRSGAGGRAGSEEYADGPAEASGSSRRLSDLLDVPAVAEALATGPDRWRQVSCLDDEFDPAPVTELAQWMWVWATGEDGWELAVEDEVKPYVDLDVDEYADAAIRVLRSHPSVTDAWHEDREVYRVETSRQMSLGERAGLAARALVAHHLDAVARLGAGG